MLVLSHAIEAELRVVDDVGEMVVIEDFDLVPLDVVCPDCSLGEGLRFAVGEGIQS